MNPSLFSEINRSKRKKNHPSPWQCFPPPRSVHPTPLAPPKLSSEKFHLYHFHEPIRCPSQWRHLRWRYQVTLDVNRGQLSQKIWKISEEKQEKFAGGIRTACDQTIGLEINKGPFVRKRIIQARIESSLIRYEFKPRRFQFEIFDVSNPNRDYKTEVRE